MSKIRDFVSNGCGLTYGLFHGGTVTCSAEGAGPCCLGPVRRWLGAGVRAGSLAAGGFPRFRSVATGTRAPRPGALLGFVRLGDDGRVLVHESRLELARLLLADFDPQICRIYAQPFRIVAPHRWPGPEPCAGLSAGDGGRNGPAGERQAGRAPGSDSWPGIAAPAWCPPRRWSGPGSACGTASSWRTPNCGWRMAGRGMKSGPR
jgi:hypothetical protein